MTSTISATIADIDPDDDLECKLVIIKNHMYSQNTKIQSGDKTQSYRILFDN